MTAFTPTHKTIRLKEPTEVSTGYRGRGLQPLSKVLPAGAKVVYNTSQNLTDGPEVVLHEVIYTEGRETYRAVKRLPKEEKAQ